MNMSLIRKTTINPFEMLREIGFSATRMKRFEKLRQHHEAMGRALMVLSWPDGIWCVLILHTERLGVVVLDDVEKAEAYHDARQMVCESITPILHLRFELHA